MTDRQEEHLKLLLEQVRERMDNKFRRGAVEHASDLMDAGILSVLDEAVDEVVDLLTYLLTMRMMMGGRKLLPTVPPAKDEEAPPSRLDLDT